MPNRPVELSARTLLQTVVCLVAAGCIVVWNLPGFQSQTTLYSKAKPVVERLGLWQSWGMFAHPVTAAFTVRLAMLSKGDTVSYHTLLPLHPGHGFSSERMMALNMLSDQGGIFIMPMLDYYCRQDSNLQAVSLQWAPAPIPKVGEQGSNPFSTDEAQLKFQPFQSRSCLVQ